MKRRNFIGTITADGTAIFSLPISGLGGNFETNESNKYDDLEENVT